MLLSQKEGGDSIPKKICAECGKKPAIFIYHGEAKSDNDHDCCPACWRNLKNSAR
jgi:hypothetical protein